MITIYFLLVIMNSFMNYESIFSYALDLISLFMIYYELFLLYLLFLVHPHIYDYSLFKLLSLPNVFLSSYRHQV